MKRVLFTDAVIHTMESEKAFATSMLVENGVIRALSVTRKEAEQLCGPGNVTCVSLQGRHVYPCMTDGHVHLLQTLVLLAEGFDVCRIQSGGVVPDSLAGVEKRLRKFAQEKPRQAMIVGNQYIITAIGEHRLPFRQELDEWCQGRPTVIYTIDGHASALSTAMLEKLGIPAQGHSGILSGEAHERVQGRMIDLIASQVTPGILARGIANFHNACAEYGISCVGALEGNGDSPKDLTTKLSVLLARRFDVDVRFYFQYMNIEKAMPLTKFQTHRRIGGCGDWEMDGSIGAHTAAFSAPFRDTGICAPTYYTQEEVDAAVEEADRRGFQVASHAIGDQAIERIVKALAKTSGKILHRIEHCEFASDDSVEEIARRGYAVMAQPGYSWIDKRFLHTYDRYLSEETLRLMKFKTYVDRGICICGSSDSPVQSLDPWLQMLGMVQFYREEESVTPYEAFCCYTVNAAKAIGESHRRGRLIPGMRADFFTGDRNIFEMNPKELADFRPMKTYYAGKPARRWEGSVFELAKMLFCFPKKV